uniref:Amino acid transporter transmembrane domain-containing protein n=1 Tax=Bionectria ochroleuca TaxID=29856 RepID=A0A8H7KE01_BIOOC
MSSAVSPGAAQRAAILGGSNTVVGARLDGKGDYHGQVGSPLTDQSPHSNSASSLEDGSDLPLVANTFSIPTDKHRTCHWAETAFLMMAEFVSFAILSFPHAYATMGWVLGIAATLFVGLGYLYTSLVLWDLCLRHPESKSICDIGKTLCGKYGAMGFWFTACMFVCNNIWVQGIHVNLGGNFFQNVVLNGKSVGISARILGGLVATFLCLLCSLPRTLKVLSRFAMAAVASTVTCVVLAMIFIVNQGGPVDSSGQTEGSADAVIVKGRMIVFSAWPSPDATFKDIMVAFLGIAFAFIGQITLPSFIAEMNDPRDFPKALYLSSFSQYSLFITFALFMYKNIGLRDMTAITIGSLERTQLIICFCFLLPSLIILGSLYATVTGLFILNSVESHISKKRTKNIIWVIIITLLWGLAFTISQVIPQFDALLAIVGAIFDGFFGWIYWGSPGSRVPRVWGPRMDVTLGVVNMSLVLIGMGLFLGIGSWASFAYLRDLEHNKN